MSNLPSKWAVEPNRYQDGYIEPDRGEQSTYALGRLVALSSIQCKVAKESDYFESAAPLIRKLVGQHNTLAIHLADTGSARGDVCSTAAAIIKLI